MTKPALPFLGSLFLLCFLCACAQQTDVVKLYENPAAAGQRYERFLVIGIAGDVETRRQIEDAIAQRLQSGGASAVAGYTVTGSKTTLLQDEIDAAARHSSADAILVNHIISVDTMAQTQEGRTDIKTECRSGDPADYFLYDYEELREPDTVKLALTVVAVTNLYDAGSGERMWTIQSTCFDKATMDEVMIEEAAAIARQLRIDGFTR